jgi:hypothetical protein
MKIQVLKMTMPESFTVIHDTERDFREQYELYFHDWEQNKYGVYTKRKYLVDRVKSMGEAVAIIGDILRDKSSLGFAQSKKLQAKYGN